MDRCVLEEAGVSRILSEVFVCVCDRGEIVLLRVWLRMYPSCTCQLSTLSVCGMAWRCLPPVSGRLTGAAIDPLFIVGHRCWSPLVVEMR